MPHNPLRILKLAMVAVAIVSSSSSAQPVAEAGPPDAAAVVDMATVRLRYAVAMRRGTQTDIGPGLIYNGYTPNDFGLDVSFFGAGMFGAGLSVDREAFALLQDSQHVAGGALYRGFLGPAVRLPLGPIQLEALVGYSFDQLASFGSSAAPSFAPATRHSAIGQAKLKLNLGDLGIEAHAEYPFALSVTNAGSAKGFSGGGVIGYRLGNSGRLAYGLVGHYTYNNDTVTIGDTVSAQTIHRAGIGLELAYLSRPPPPPPPKFGGLLLTVVDEKTQAPLPNATVTLTGRGDPRTLTTDATGKARVDMVLEPGEYTAKAVTGGYVPSEGKATIVAGTDASLSILAKKEPPKVGALAIKLLDKLSGAPIPGGKITFRGQQYEADASGAVTLSDLKPGPAQIAAVAPGYNPGQEFAEVVAFQTATVAVPMVKEKEKVLATLTGYIKSALGGRPVQAKLEIPEQRLNGTANNEGTFTFRVPGGTYRVIISAKGYISQTKSVTVRDGDQAIFNVDLHPVKRR